MLLWRSCWRRQPASVDGTLRIDFEFDANPHFSVGTFEILVGDRRVAVKQSATNELRHVEVPVKKGERIGLSVPDKVEGAMLPPLVLASFVENAFKHGISYDKPSFVDVSLAEEGGKIVFRCVNSRQESASGQGRGIGLQNVRTRLDLLYGEGYTLHIDERENVYDVLLVLPRPAGEKGEGA